MSCRYLCGRLLCSSSLSTKLDRAESQRLQQNHWRRCRAGSRKPAKTAKSGHLVVSPNHGRRPRIHRMWPHAARRAYSGQVRTTHKYYFIFAWCTFKPFLQMQKMGLLFFLPLFLSCAEAVLSVHSFYLDAQWEELLWRIILAYIAGSPYSVAWVVSRIFDVVL